MRGDAADSTSPARRSDKRSREKKRDETGWRRSTRRGPSWFAKRCSVGPWTARARPDDRAGRYVRLAREEVCVWPEAAATDRHRSDCEEDDDDDEDDDRLSCLRLEEREQEEEEDEEEEEDKGEEEEQDDDDEREKVDSSDDDERVEDEEEDDEEDDEEDEEENGDEVEERGKRRDRRVGSPYRDEVERGRKREGFGKATGKRRADRKAEERGGDRPTDRERKEERKNPRRALRDRPRHRRRSLSPLTSPPSPSTRDYGQMFFEALQYLREIAKTSSLASWSWTPAKRFSASVASWDARVYSVPAHERLKETLAAQKIVLDLTGFVAAVDDERDKLRRQKEALLSLRSSLLARLEHLRTRTRDARGTPRQLPTLSSSSSSVIRERAREKKTGQKSCDKKRGEIDEDVDDDDDDDVERERGDRKKKEEDEGKQLIKVEKVEEDEEQEKDEEVGSREDDARDAATTPGEPAAAYRRVELQFYRERMRMIGDLLSSLASLLAANEESSIWNAIESNWSIVSFSQQKKRVVDMLRDAVRRRKDNDEKSAEISGKVRLLGKKDLLAEIQGYASSFSR